MVERTEYMSKLIKLKNTDIIKVITGIRRCGKSTLLRQFQERLIADGVQDEQIISLNMEELENEPLLEYHKLHEYILSRLCKEKMTYIFLDEIQLVAEFQKVVDSLFIRDNTDIYITGSNAYMLSGELSTLLSGRYIEIQMLPLSFKEYWELVGGDKQSAWDRYFVQGGFPYLSKLQDASIRADYLMGIYNTVLLKDIVKRKKIQDVALLESVIKFLFDNIGNIVNPKKIADTLVSSGRKTTSVTIENYITALTEAFILYKVGRYDIKGKQYLKSLEKYYIPDVGLRQLLIKNKNADIGHILENIVYLELLRRGHKVSIGKVGELEIDFVAENTDGVCYYQVSASILDEGTYNREVEPLKRLRDNHPKYVITMDRIPINDDGIKQINIVDFLLSK